MKVLEILQERRIQNVNMMYHGTSSKYLRSILKHGLLPFTGQAGYGSEEYPSLGGVYLTTQRTVAKHAALDSVDINGGEPILISVQYVDMSGTIDEDAVYDKLVTIGLTYFGKPLTPEISARIVPRALEHIQQFAASTQKTAAQVEAFYKTMFALMSDKTNVELNQLIASSRYSAAQERLMNDPALRTAMTALLDATRAKSGTAKEVRVTRPIKFKGKTRILSIEHLRTGEVYYRS